MFKFLQSKKGFTLVELMIVLIVMGFGAFALINLFRVAYRSFEKTEERYIKQEEVKFLAEFLQKRTGIGASNSASVFADQYVIPQKSTQIVDGVTTTYEGADKSYSYLFTTPVSKLDTPDSDGDNYAEFGEPNFSSDDCCGYRLYMLDKGKKRSDAVLIGDPNVPLFIIMRTIKDEESGENIPAVNLEICAVEDDAVFKQISDTSGDYDGLFVPTAKEAKEDEPITISDIDYDEIYYKLNVSYHFPNMATSEFDVVVNSSGTRDKDGNFIPDKANSAKNGSTAVTSVNAVDTGSILRVTIDSILSGDNSEAAATVSSFCFIATASYGVKSGEVGLLCDFRDNCLLTNAPGRLFVKTYYAISPPIADFIAQHETLRAAVRTMLKPLVVVAEYSLNHELISEVAPSLIFAFALGLPLSATAVVINKKRKRGED